MDSEATGESVRPVPTLRVLYTGGQIVSQDPFALGAGATLVGRDPKGGGVRLADDPRMSRTHATLTVTPSGLKLVDNGSRNGTKVNGAPISEATLHDGDVVRFGDSITHIRMEPVECADADLPELVGVAPSMRELRATVAMLGPHEVGVLLLGESGCGKSLVARSIHQASRRSGDFVAVNCGAIPEGLAESAFFGHKAGSFTGASADQKGYFRAAIGGTLFIDEVGDMPAALQPKLLHAVEDGAVTPVGATRPVPCDVRIVAATNVDVRVAMHEGRFRGDLYARIAEMVVKVPPLRDRREDILLLLSSALEGFDKPLSPDLAEALMVYRWPFNVRELLATATELKVRGAGKSRLELDLVRDRLESWQEVTAPPPLARRFELAPKREEMPTKEEVETLLRTHRGVVTKAAAASGRSRQQVYRWIRRYSLDPDQYRG